MKLMFPFFPISGPELMSKYVGEGENRLRDLFSKASEAADPFSIIFFDEIDSVAINRAESDSNIDARFVSQLLSLMDGYHTRDNIIVIATTNIIDNIDAAFKRPGRFDFILFIGPPDDTSRKNILQVCLKSVKNDVNIDQLVSLTEGYSGADLSGLISRACMVCCRRCCKYSEVSGRFELLDEIFVTNEDCVFSLKK